MPLMNRERLTIIAEWLEAGGHHNPIVPFEFDMLEVRSDCGTAACIVGAADDLWGHAFERDEISPYHRGVMALGLDGYNGNLLADPANYWPEQDLNFPKPNEWPMSNRDIGPAWAARTVRHLIKTGEVCWHLTRNPEVAE